MKQRRVTRIFRCRKGVAALEFALISLPLLMIVFGTFEFGRLLWTQQALENAAIAGARCMGILAASCSSGGSYSSTNTQSYIEGIASAWGVTLDSSNFSPALTRSSANSECSGLSEVTLTYTFETVVPGLLSMLSSNALIGHACFPNDS